jgi:hypothetical protein
VNLPAYSIERDNMKSFYHKKFDSYLDPARELDMEVDKLLRPIFEKYTKLGYPPHEIEQVMGTAITMLSCSIIMERTNKIEQKAFKKRMAKVKQEILGEGE